MTKETQAETAPVSSVRIVFKTIHWLIFLGTLTCLVAGWLWWYWARGNVESLEDQAPIITPGLVDLIGYGLTILSAGWVGFLLIWKFSGRWRWLSLPLAIVGLVAGLFLFFQSYRVVFDADMNPLRVEALVSAYELSPEGAITEPLKVSATDFPRYLGPHQDAKIHWLEWTNLRAATKPTPLWRQPIGYAWSGFTAIDGVAFTMEQQGPWECVTAYDLESGKLLWVHKDRHRHDDPAGGIGPRSTPTFHQGRLYTLGAHGTLNCLDARTGDSIWQVELTAKYGIPLVVANPGSDLEMDIEQSNVIWGRAASPLIYQDRVIVPVGGKDRSDSEHLTSLAAFSIHDGSVVWEGGNRQISYGSPVLATVDGVPQILITNEDTVSGHDPETGQELWFYNRTGLSDGPANTSQPIVVDDQLILLSKEYGLGGELIRVTKDPNWEARKEWASTRVLRTKLTVPVIHGDFAYCISGGILECCRWDTGERMWRGERVQHGQLLLIDDHLLVMSEKGKLLWVPAIPDEFRIEQEWEDCLSGRCWNMLCVTGNRLLARSDLEAVCLELPATIIEEESSSTKSEVPSAPDTIQ